MVVGYTFVPSIAAIDIFRVFVDKGRLKITGRVTLAGKSDISKTAINFSGITLVDFSQSRDAFYGTLIELRALDTLIRSLHEVYQPISLTNGF